MSNPKSKRCAIYLPVTGSGAVLEHLKGKLIQLLSGTKNFLDGETSIRNQNFLDGEKYMSILGFFSPLSW